MRKFFALALGLLVLTTLSSCFMGKVAIKNSDPFVMKMDSTQAVDFLRDAPLAVFLENKPEHAFWVNGIATFVGSDEYSKKISNSNSNLNAFAAKFGFNVAISYVSNPSVGDKQVAGYIVTLWGAKDEQFVKAKREISRRQKNAQTEDNLNNFKFAEIGSDAITLFCKLNWVVPVDTRLMAVDLADSTMNYWGLSFQKDYNRYRIDSMIGTKYTQVYRTGKRYGYDVNDFLDDLERVPSEIIWESPKYREVLSRSFKSLTGSWEIRIFLEKDKYGVSTYVTKKMLIFEPYSKTLRPSAVRSANKSYPTERMAQDFVCSKEQAKTFDKMAKDLGINFVYQTGYTIKDPTLIPKEVVMFYNSTPAVGSETNRFRETKLWAK